MKGLNNSLATTRNEYRQQQIEYVFELLHNFLRENSSSIVVVNISKDLHYFGFEKNDKFSFSSCFFLIAKEVLEKWDLTGAGYKASILLVNT